MIATRLAERAGIALKRKGYQGFYGTGCVAGEEATILLPQTYMNRSGTSVAPACQSLGVASGDLIVVHDEIDLDYGTVRIKVGGGHAGHNGLRSICEVLDDPGFVRLRAGIGRPPTGGDVSSYVLSRFNAAERAALVDFIGSAVAALEEVLVNGPQTAMNNYNQRRL
jgi:PTH1 family peptidyl-tRNA hydrolase